MAFRLACLPAVCAGVLLLYAASDEVTDAPGVTVELNGSAILHRIPVAYPAAARQAGVEGTVVADVTLDAHANVSDAHIVTGPAELRRTVLESVLRWHFTGDAANGTRQLSIQFQLPANASAATAPGPDFRPAIVVSAPSPAGPFNRPIESIDILGLPPEARSDLHQRLPAHEGDMLSAETAAMGRAVREFDEHLGMGFRIAPSGGTIVEIVVPGYPQSPEPALAIVTPGYPRNPEPAFALPVQLRRLRVAPEIQARKLKLSASPEYPPEAKLAHIQGVVKLGALLAKDGTVEKLTVIGGHPLLAPAALAAVQQWVYQPTALNGAPVEVEAEVDVNFSLAP